MRRQVGWLTLLRLLLVLLLLLLLQPWRGAREGQRRPLAGICRTNIVLKDSFCKCLCTRLTSACSKHSDDGAGYATARSQIPVMKHEELSERSIA